MDNEPDPFLGSQLNQESLVKQEIFPRRETSFENLIDVKASHSVVPEIIAHLPDILRNHIKSVRVVPSKNDPTESKNAEEWVGLGGTTIILRPAYVVKPKGALQEVTARMFFSPEARRYLILHAAGHAIEGIFAHAKAYGNISSYLLELGATNFFHSQAEDPFLPRFTENIKTVDPTIRYEALRKDIGVILASPKSKSRQYRDALAQRGYTIEDLEAEAFADLIARAAGSTANNRNTYWMTADLVEKARQLWKELFDIKAPYKEIAGERFLLELTQKTKA